LRGDPKKEPEASGEWEMGLANIQVVELMASKAANHWAGFAHPVTDAAGLEKREFADRLRKVPSYELSQVKRNCISSLRLAAIQRVAFIFGPQITLAYLLRKVLCLRSTAGNKQTQQIMSESTSIPTTATAIPTGCDSKSAPCADAQKQPQPQPASTPTAPPVTRKGFKRQAHKQH
jgi:hypothetical protein